MNIRERSVHLELHDDDANSHKYLDVVTAGKKFHIVGGRCDGYGKSGTEVDYGTKPISELDKYISSKKKKGYIEESSTKIGNKIQEKSLTLELHDDDANSHKYYTLQSRGKNKFDVVYGRLDGYGRSGTEVDGGTHDMSEWDKIVSSKKKKGYQESTKRHLPGIALIEAKKAIEKLGLKIVKESWDSDQEIDFDLDSKWDDDQLEDYEEEEEADEYETSVYDTFMSKFTGENWQEALEATSNEYEINIVDVENIIDKIDG